MKIDKKVVQDIIEWIICIIIALIIGILVRHYVGSPTIVKRTSMYPTLVEDERIMLNKIFKQSELERGDIITFEAPSKTNITSDEVNKTNPVAIYDREINGLFENFNYYVLEFSKDSYIKRVIGLPGDHILIQNGKVYINEEELEEDYLQDDIITQAGIFNDITVPEGYIFAVGDNREVSKDSRAFGCVPYEKIESKIIMRFWPLNKFQFYK